jgi:hypothetical protein
MRDGCVKIIRCSEENFRVKKHDNTWSNVMWDSFKLKCKGGLNFRNKATTSFAHNAILYE